MKRRQLARKYDRLKQQQKLRKQETEAAARGKHRHKERRDVADGEQEWERQRGNGNAKLSALQQNGDGRRFPCQVQNRYLSSKPPRKLQPSTSMYGGLGIAMPSVYLSFYQTNSESKRDRDSGALSDSIMQGEKKMNQSEEMKGSQNDKSKADNKIRIDSNIGIDECITSFMKRFIKVWESHVDGWSSAKRPYSASRRRQVQESMEWKKRLEIKKKKSANDLHGHLNDKNGKPTHSLHDSDDKQSSERSPNVRKKKPDSLHVCDGINLNNDTNRQRCAAIEAYAKIKKRRIEQHKRDKKVAPTYPAERQR